MDNWNPLGWIMWAVYQLIDNYGWALVIFVVLTRVIMFPFGIKTQKSQARMMAIQPKLQQLQKQYAKNQQRYQEEMMKLYEKEGVSPMGGCLPSLIPMILLFGIIDVIYKPLQYLLLISSETLNQARTILTNAGLTTAGDQLTMINIIKAGETGAHADVLTQLTGIFSAEQIAQIEGFNMSFLGLNLGAVPKEALGWLIVVPFLAFAAQMGYTLYSMWQQKKNGQQQMQGAMKWVMLLMPLLSLYWGFTMPAGVGVYWFLSSALMLIQQLILQKMYPPEKVLAMKDKSADRQREKMKKQRERMEKYNQQMADRGLSPNGKPLSAESEEAASEEEPVDSLKEKELNKRRLAEARRRMAEKYGDEYKED